MFFNLLRFPSIMYHLNRNPSILLRLYVRSIGLRLIGGGVTTSIVTPFKPSSITTVGTTVGTTFVTTSVTAIVTAAIAASVLAFFMNFSGLLMSELVVSRETAPVRRYGRL